MSTLQNVGLTVCVCSVAACIISLLVPSGKTQKLLNLVIGVFLIVSIIIPLKGIFKDIKLEQSVENTPESIIEDSESGYEKQVISTTADNLVTALNSLLEQEDIHPKNIKISLSKGNENSIYISKINIYISKEDKSKISRIRQICEDNFKKTPLIIAEN